MREHLFMEYLRATASAAYSSGVLYGTFQKNYRQNALEEVLF